MKTSRLPVLPMWALLTIIRDFGAFTLAMVDCPSASIPKVIPKCFRWAARMARFPFAMPIGQEGEFFATMVRSKESDETTQVNRRPGNQARDSEFFSEGITC